MKARGKNAVLLLTGMLVGLALAPTAAHAVNQYLTATPSTQTFYVNGQQVELEAYGINGYNYVKLRDVGQLVDFNVAYDPSRNAAVIEPDKPYTGEDVATPTPAPSVQPSEGTDYALQANPAIFTGELTHEAYNGIRDAVVNREAILAGDYQAIPITSTATRNGDVYKAALAIGCYPLYEIKTSEDGQRVCNVRYAEAYKAVADHTQGFIDTLAPLSEKEKVEQIAWYVCDRLTYSTKSASITKVLGQDSVQAGNCMVYAQSFQFLCDRIGIPCIRIQSQTHQWNRVYVDGAWQDVDVSSLDAGDDTHQRSYATVLHESTEMQGKDFVDNTPMVTTFAMEVLVPGSTK